MPWHKSQTAFPPAGGWAELNSAGWQKLINISLINFFKDVVGWRLGAGQEKNGSPDDLDWAEGKLCKLAKSFSGFELAASSATGNSGFTHYAAPFKKALSYIPHLSLVRN